MKVQLDFKITDKVHTLYQSYFSNHPKGVEYKKSEFKIAGGKLFIFFKRIYQFLRKFGLINQKIIDKANDSLRKDENFDLIHFANHLGKTDKPCVVDYEGVSAFAPNLTEEEKNNAIKFLCQKNLRYLLPMNKEILKSFNLFFKNKKFEFKQEVLYPVTCISEKFRKQVKKENIVVFAGSSNIRNEDIFYRKGGYETLLAFEILSKKFPNFKFIFVGDIPKDIQISDRKNFILKKVVHLGELYQLFNKSKVFLQPCFSTPATIFLIAMWFKLPIVTYNFWANKEYVNSKSGILIDPEKIDVLNKFNLPDTLKAQIQIKQNAPKNAKKIVKAIEKLIKDENLRKKMGEEGFKMVSKGKFSVEKRNKKILRIYGEVLK